MEFYSQFWNGATFAADAEALLRQFDDASNPQETRARALALLAEHPSVVVRGVALDNFSMLHSQRRHGAQPLVDAVEPSIRACAVQELAAPPYLRSEANAKPRLGANHGSAFYAMWALVTRDDGPLIALALAKNEDPSVLWYGIKAASGAIYRQRDIDPGLAEMLRLLATNPSQDAKVRATAIGAVSTSSSDKFTPWLLSTLADPALVVSAAAARTLLELDKPRFRAIVEPVAATWPPDSEAPYDATETRRLLEDDTETEDNPEAEDDPSDAEDSV